ISLRYPSASPKPMLDHDEFGSNRSKLINVIDSNFLARDSREKPVSTFSHPALVAGGGEMCRKPGADIEGDLTGAAFYRGGARLQVGERLVDVVIGDVRESAALIDGLAAGHVLQREARHDAHRRTVRLARVVGILDRLVLGRVRIDIQPIAVGL